MINNKLWFCVIKNIKDYHKAKLILEFNKLDSKLESNPINFPLVIINGHFYLMTLPYERGMLKNCKQIDLSDILKHQ